MTSVTRHRNCKGSHFFDPYLNSFVVSTYTLIIYNRSDTDTVFLLNGQYF